MDIIFFMILFSPFLFEFIDSCFVLCFYYTMLDGNYQLYC